MKLKNCIIAFTITAFVQILIGAMAILAQSQMQHAKYSLRQTLSIGEDDIAKPENLLARPRHVVSDKRGYIWVSDEATLSIKLFNRMGNCVTTIGGRGQGPENFQDITAITIDAENNLVVVDYLNHKIAIFSPAGTFLRSYPFAVTSVAWPRRISITPDSEFVMLASSENNPYIFHHFSKKFVYLRSFGELPIIHSKNERFERMFAKGTPGNLYTDARGVLYYIPGIYNGKIYLYQKDDLINTLSAPERSIQPYEMEFSPTFKPGPPPAKYQTVLASGTEMYYARRNIISGGLNILENGILAHLVTLYQGEKHEIGLELFKNDGKEVEYHRLAGTELPDGQWCSSSGKWYLIDYQDIPRVFEYIVESKN